MKTYYVKRGQIHTGSRFGIQVSCVETDLMRVTVGRPRMTDVWQWVCTGEHIQGDELAQLFRVYPVCKFLDDGDLHWRAIARVEKSRKSKDGEA